MFPVTRATHFGIPVLGAAIWGSFSSSVNLDSRKTGWMPLVPASASTPRSSAAKNPTPRPEVLRGPFRCPRKNGDFWPWLKKVVGPPVVYFTRGTLPQKRGEKGTTGGPRYLCFAAAWMEQSPKPAQPQLCIFWSHTHFLPLTWHLWGTWKMSFLSKGASVRCHVNGGGWGGGMTIEKHSPLTERDDKVAYGILAGPSDRSKRWIGRVARTLSPSGLTKTCFRPKVQTLSCGEGLWQNLELHFCCSLANFKDFILLSLRRTGRPIFCSSELGVIQRSVQLAIYYFIASSVWGGGENEQEEAQKNAMIKVLYLGIQFC